MRKRATNRTTYEEAVSLPELTKSVLQLRERVTRLEGGVEDTEPTILSTIPPSMGQRPETRGMGRKPKLPKKELLKRRDRLSYWLEQSWPNLAEKLLAPRNAAFAAYAFVKAKNAENSFEHPKAVAPEMSSLKVNSGTIPVELKPYSLTVYRIPIQ